jgi:hypothetical protein
VERRVPVVRVARRRDRPQARCPVPRAEPAQRNALDTHLRGPAVDPPKRFVWRTLPTRLLPDSTEWTFELADSGDHTRLIQSMRILHIPGPYESLFAIMLPQHRDRTADLEGDLLRIKGP